MKAYMQRLVRISAVGMLPLNSSILNACNKRPFSGLVATAYVGLSKEFSVATRAIEQHILPHHKAELEKVTSMCLLDALEEFAFQGILAKFDDPMMAFTQLDLI